MLLVFAFIIASVDVGTLIQIKPYGDDGYAFLYDNCLLVRDGSRIMHKVDFEKFEVKKPVGFVVDNGRFWVLDSRKNSVFLFDKRGSLLQNVPTAPLRSPKSIAMHDGVLFIGGQSLKGAGGGVAFLSERRKFEAIKIELEPFFEHADELWKSFKVFSNQSGLGVGLVFYNEMLTVDNEGAILARQDLSDHISIYPKSKNDMILPEKYSAFAFSSSLELGTMIVTCQEEGFKCMELLMIKESAIKKMPLSKSAKDVGYNATRGEIYLLYMDGSYEFLEYRQVDEALQ